MRTHHILIGPPGSGKTTLALALQQLLPHSEVISTDAIRNDLYGNPTIQGNWPEIFAQVQRQCEETIAGGKTIVYDATNVKREWRSSILNLFSDPWVGWHLTTPLNTCLTWNQQRDRQVPETVIQDLYRALEGEGIDRNEGMDVIEAIDISQYPDLPQHLLERLPPLAAHLKEVDEIAKEIYADQKSFTRRECRRLASLAIELRNYTLPTYGDCLDNICSVTTTNRGQQ